MSRKVTAPFYLTLAVLMFVAGCSATPSSAPPERSPDVTAEAGNMDEPRSDPDGRYRVASFIARQAILNRYAARKDRLAAEEQYELAIDSLREIQLLYPDWKKEAISKKLDVLRRSLAELRGETIIPPSAPPPPPGKAPASERAPAVETTAHPGSSLPDQPSDGDFIGHKMSKKVHRADCQWGQKISARNRIYFDTYQEAAAAGYVPCKSCKPDQAAAEASAPPAAEEAGGDFIGHRGSKKVHRADCQWAQKISARNRIYFRTYEEAVFAGYVPCKSCKPDQAPAVSVSSGEASSSATEALPPPADEYWASGKGKTFHRPDCRWAAKISEQNLVKYPTRQEALDAGKKPCRVCKP